MNSNTKITKEILSNAFSMLDEMLDKQGIRCHICIYGGSAFLMINEMRKMTGDVDYRILSINSLDGRKEFALQNFRKAVQTVGSNLDLPENWMNDAVKGFISQNEELIESKDYKCNALSVSSPSLEYLLAMKCMSMRSFEDSPHDKNDIKVLLNILKIQSSEQVFDIIEKFYPVQLIQAKTLFGVQELIDNIREEQCQQLPSEETNHLQP